nr:hypothetical protein [Mammaliicoccus sp. Marseille-Q6498]
MNEVQLKVLELIEKGIINVDEAVKLLEATSSTQKSGFTSKSKENVETLFEDLLDKVKTTAKSGKTEFDKQFKDRTTSESDPIQQLDESLRNIIRSFNKNNGQNKDL